MSMVKEAAATAAKNGNFNMAKGSENRKTKQRPVRAPYPSEPTTISKAVLHKAMNDAMDKLHQGKG